MLMLLLFVTKVGCLRSYKRNICYSKEGYGGMKWIVQKKA